MQTRSDEIENAEEMPEDVAKDSEAVEALEAADAVEADRDETGAVAQRLAELESENAEARDRLLRLAAEMENLRRRTERDVADARRYAVSAFAAEILNVGDNLRRAIEAVPEGETRDGALGDVLAGVEMTERELQKALEKHGVQRIEAAGERFDPKLHQAMFKVPSDDAAPGTVVQVLQEGYTIGERTLRPARVSVAQGEPSRSNDASADEGS